MAEFTLMKLSYIFFSMSDVCLWLLINISNQKFEIGKVKDS